MTAAVASDSRVIDSELRAAIERIAQEVLPQRGAVTEMVRLHAPAGARAHLQVEELSIGFDDGSSMQVIFKDLSPAAPAARGRGGGGSNGNAKGPARARPSFLEDPRREIAAYRSVLAVNQVGAPRFLGAVEDETRGRFWLFLEDVSGVALAELKFEYWLDAARWLAGMHLQFESQAQGLARESTLLRYDADYFQLWILRAAEYQPALRPLMGQYGRVVDRLSGMPVTFVHGAFTASNVLMQNSPWGPLVRPLDWAMAGIGPGALDLAALMSVGWNGAARGALLRAYYEVWSQGAHAGTSIERFHEDVSFCRLHHALQCAGWSQHCGDEADAPDWPREALRLAGKLGIAAAQA